MATVSRGKIKSKKAQSHVDNKHRKSPAKKRKIYLESLKTRKTVKTIKYDCRCHFSKKIYKILDN